MISSVSATPRGPRQPPKSTPGRLKMTLRTAYHALAGVALAGTVSCFGLAPFSSHSVTAENPPLRFEDFFAGHTRGKGTLELLTGRRQSLQGEGHGHKEADGSFRLDQVITSEGGAVEKRTWRLIQSHPGIYTGTLSGVDGPVSGEVTGNRFHLRYLVQHPAVYMEQFLYLQPDGRTILNQATITVIGQPWARLTEEISRVDAREQGSEKARPTHRTRPARPR